MSFYKDWSIDEFVDMNNRLLDKNKMAVELGCDVRKIYQLRDRARGHGFMVFNDPNYTEYSIEPTGLSPFATDAVPGSAEKVEVMAARFLAGHEIHHPADRIRYDFVISKVPAMCDPYEAPKNVQRRRNAS